MKSNRYDILVVGAGPAGASAAAEAARRQMRVLVVDRRPVIGFPVQCAEYIPAPLIGELDIEKRYIVQAVRGLKTYLNDRQIKASLTKGFIIKRDVFDRLLADKARQNGARVLTATRALAKDGDLVVIKTKGCPLVKIFPRVIIGADGPLSTVGKWTQTTNKRMIAAAQVQVPLVSGLDFAQVYFEPDLYAGYAWFFPRGTVANVGLGVKKRGNACPPLGPLLERFLRQRVRDGSIENKILNRISGWIPAGALEKIVHENILLTGDAAGQTHPITGAGIFPAVTCGRMAGKWAARAVAADDLSQLNHYEQEYTDLFGDTMQRALDRRRLMESNWDRLGDILKSCWVVFKEYYAGT